MNAQEYMRHWETKKVWTHLAWPKHQRRFDVIATKILGETMVDVGCAYGHSTQELASRLPATKWAGMDFFPDVVQIARRFFPHLEFFFCAGYDMAAALGGRTFDTAVCSEVIEHIPDDTEFVKQIVRVARRRIVLTTPNVRVSDPGHLRLYTERGLATLFHGLDREIISDGPFFYIVVNQ